MSGINLSDWALKHRSLVVYMMMIAVVGGALSYFRLGRNEIPPSSSRPWSSRPRGPAQLWKRR